MLGKATFQGFFLKVTSDNLKGSCFDLNQTKLLIGRAPHCDITVDHPSVSYYHALISLSDGNIHIMDLHSHEGIKVNNVLCKESTITVNDILQIGPITFECHQKEILSDAILVADVDPIYKPPTNLTLIEDEYCDITFSGPTNLIHNTDLSLADKLNEHYIDVEPDYQNNLSHDESHLLKSTQRNRNCLCLTTYLNGHMVKSDYIYGPHSNIYITGNPAKKKNHYYIPGLAHHERELLVSAQSETQVHSLNGFTANRDQLSFEHGALIFTRDSLQISIEKVQSPPALKNTRFFQLEKEFLQESSKVLAALLIFMISILIIDTSIPKPPKKLAIIYKRKKLPQMTESERSKEVPDQKDTKTGIKDKDSIIKEPKFAQKQNKVNKKKSEQQVKTVAQAKKTTQAQKSKPAKPAKTPVKAYKFNPNKYSKFMNKTHHYKSLAQAKNNHSTAHHEKFSGARSKSLKGSPSPLSAPNSLGSDRSGQSARSSGSYGLSSKRGFNTIESSPKTIVLGSIDPELLRKILQEYIPQFKYCYQQELRRNEKAQGIIDLSFRILKSGQVSRIKVASTQTKFSPSGVSCMSRVLKIIKFPIPKGGGIVDVKQPLNFVSNKTSY